MWIRAKGAKKKDQNNTRERRIEKGREKETGSERKSELCYKSSSSSCRSVSPEQRKILLPRLAASRVVSDRRTVGILPRVSSVRFVRLERTRSGQSRSSGRGVRNKGRRQDLWKRETE